MSFHSCRAGSAYSSGYQPSAKVCGFKSAHPRGKTTSAFNAKCRSVGPTRATSSGSCTARTEAERKASPKHVVRAVADLVVEESSQHVH
eukprot:scaffold5287_cov345-Prasinococcus_capsulatus_cf.AAC.2